MTETLKVDVDVEVEVEVEVEVGPSFSSLMSWRRLGVNYHLCCSLVDAVVVYVDNV